MPGEISISDVEIKILLGLDYLANVKKEFFAAQKGKNASSDREMKLSMIPEPYGVNLSILTGLSQPTISNYTIRLNLKGLIMQKTGNQRDKPYRLTGEGKEELEKWMNSLDDEEKEELSEIKLIFDHNYNNKLKERMRKKIRRK